MLSGSCEYGNNNARLFRHFLWILITLPQQLKLKTQSHIVNPVVFHEQVLNWFDQHGRKDLPWQRDITPYRVWISEIMLQQTQVSTVIPYYLKFMASFPDAITLANADQDDVLKHWSGLGYYARARNLHKAAQTIRDDYSGNFPDNIDDVIALSGIGRSTAGAILSISCQQSHAILDGNVKRVLARYYAVDGWTATVKVQKQLWAYAEVLLPPETLKRTADYTQAMMDLGATVCTRGKPSCITCPLHDNCQALKLGKPQAYPHAKPKKAIPERKAVMLIMLDERGDVLLQKRPPIGIWGGLWSLPQFESKQEAGQWLQSEFSLGFDIAKPQAELIHTFSHFRLTIYPHVVQIDSGKQAAFQGIMEANTLLWYNINTEFKGGLAAPITKLLDTMKGKTHDKNG